MANCILCGAETDGELCPRCDRHAVYSTTSPCYGCGDRHSGCHAECRRYLVWLEAHKRQAAMAQAKELADKELNRDLAKKAGKRMRRKH